MRLSEQRERERKGIAPRTPRALAELRTKSVVNAEESRALAERFRMELLNERLGHPMDPLPDLDGERPYAWETIGDVGPFGAASLPPASIARPYDLPPEHVEMGFTREALDEQQNVDREKAETQRFLSLSPEERFAEQMRALRRFQGPDRNIPTPTHGTFAKKK